MRKLVVAFVTCASALAAILALWLANLDIARYRGLIEQEASLALGRRVAIAGELGLALSLRPTLVASGVTIANPPWASRPHLARVERLEATAALLPLLGRRVEIDRLRVDGADIRLERSADGRANWRLDRRRRAALPVPGLVSAAHAAELAEMPPLADTHVAEIAIRDADIAYRDDAAGREHRLRLARADLVASDAVSPVALSASGELDGAAIDLEGRAGPLAELLAEAPSYPVDLGLRWLGLDARIEGTLDTGGDVALDLAVDATGDDAGLAVEHLAGFVPWLASAGPDGPIRLAGRVHGSMRGPGIEDLRLAARLFGVDLRLAGAIADIGSLSGIDLAVEAEGDPAGLRSLAPRLPIGALRITGRAVGSASALMIRDLALRLGATDLAGEVTLLRHGDRPKLVGRIGSDRLSLPLGAGRWPDLSMPGAAVLGAVDADLRVETDRLVLGRLEARQVSLDVTLSGGALELDRLQADLAGSRLEGSAGLDAAGHGVALRLEAAPFDAGGLLAALGLDGLLAGHGELRVDLRAEGSAPGVWPGTLGGTARGRIEGGTIGPAAIGFDCLELSLAIARGVATPGVMRIDGPGATVEASGAIDLAEGRLDLAVTATPRAGSAPLPAITIAGPFDDPAIVIGEPGAAGGIAGLLEQLAAAPSAGGGCGRAAAPPTPQ
ncbi:MAG TPA: AsmA family protein [Geminicoccus sp.]|nr:AsmA family protein [Geminicoccus sp.]